MKRFKNRTDAGKILGQKLLSYKDDSTVILAIPRGGVPVAFEVAKHLQAPLDILLVKKISAPSNPELAIGAVSEDAKPYLNEEMIQKLSLNRKQIQLIAKQKINDVKEKLKTYRKNRKPLSLKEKTVILVDDGIATGATLSTAIQFLRTKEPNKIIVAAPVGATNAIKELKTVADEVICLSKPAPFHAVSLWYENFMEVTDAQASFFMNDSNRLLKENTEELSFSVGQLNLTGDLVAVDNMRGLVVFAHGGGSNRHSSRNEFVAQELNKAGYSTFLIDLLTEAETKDPAAIFDVQLMSQRLAAATRKALAYFHSDNVPVAFFGSGTGAEVALLTASTLDIPIYTVLCRGGRMDPTADYLDKVSAHTLLIVGANDTTSFELNAEAQKKLNSSSLSIIPKAGPLFKEAGALDKVVELSIEWLNFHLPNQSIPHVAKEEVLIELQQQARGITNTSSWNELIQHLAKKQIVMLGESSHGTEEFYRMRRLISERLIREHNFKFIAVEGDWPDCMKLNEYITKNKGRSAQDIMKQFQRWPTWMWANEEIAELIESLKETQTQFYGLDIYSLFESIDYLNSYAAKNLPELSDKIRANYACFDSFNRNEKSYARSLINFPEGCRHEVIENLREILRMRLAPENKESPDYFNAQQSARIITNAEHYYRNMLFDSSRAWNIRDQHMLDTLQQLLNQTGAQSKCIIWAHNSHIGDYHATDMLQAGYVNLGGLARERFGNEKVALVGFGTYQGQVLASEAWDGEEKVMTLLPAKPASFEDYCHQVAENMPNHQFYTLFDKLNKDSVLKQRSYGHRAVGVIYSSHFEVKGHNYVPTIPAQRYDAFIFVDKTSYLKSIPTKENRRKLPETWPGGL